MNPGKLDRRVTFGTFTSTENASQDYVQTFVPVLETWAEVRPHSGSRQLAAGELDIVDIIKFTVRYRRDFTPTKAMRILYMDQYFTIHHIDDKDNRHRFYEIITKNADNANSEN